jgi:hypothetical protein
MKKLSQIITVLIVFIFIAGNISAQSENPMLIVSFQKIKMADMQKANNLISEKIAPVINGLVDEGMLEGWGQFNHAWGDEWNMNVWYVAKDMDSFNKFFDEYLDRLNKQQPEAWTELRGYIQEHKDNIYSIENQYPLPQE